MRVKIDFGKETIMYLIVRDATLAEYRREIEVRPNEKFYDMVQKEVMAHVIDGKKPQEQILTALLNIEDDMMAGREVTMRAGDYIALMSYARKIKAL